MTETRKMKPVIASQDAPALEALTLLTSSCNGSKREPITRPMLSPINEVDRRSTKDNLSSRDRRIVKCKKQIGTAKEQSQNHYADCCSQNCVNSMTSQESAGPDKSSFEESQTDSHDKNNGRE